MKGSIVVWIGGSFEDIVSGTMELYGVAMIHRSCSYAYPKCRQHCINWPQITSRPGGYRHRQMLRRRLANLRITTAHGAVLTDSSKDRTHQLVGHAVSR